MKIFTVYMPRIAAQLRREGFKILYLGVNDKKPQYDTYIFEDTIELRKAFEKIVNQ